MFLVIKINFLRFVTKADSTACNTNLKPWLLNMQLHDAFSGSPTLQPRNKNGNHRTSKKF